MVLVARAQLVAEAMVGIGPEANAAPNATEGVYVALEFRPGSLDSEPVIVPVKTGADLAFLFGRVGTEVFEPIIRVTGPNGTVHQFSSQAIAQQETTIVI